jgi:hypothetical protein
LSAGEAEFDAKTSRFFIEGADCSAVNLYGALCDSEADSKTTG